MTRDRATLTEQERDDLCDAIVDYTGNRAASAPARFDRHVVPTVERIIAERIAQARRDAEEERDRALAVADSMQHFADVAGRCERKSNEWAGRVARVETLADKWTAERDAPFGEAHMSYAFAAHTLRAALRGDA